MILRTPWNRKWTGREGPVLVPSLKSWKLRPLVRVEDPGQLRVDPDPQRIESRVSHAPDVAQIAPVARKDGTRRILLHR